MNPRFRLRAYTEAHPVRTAAIVFALTRADPQAVITRTDAAAEWARRYPRHADQTGRRSIPARMRAGLLLLKIVDAVTVDNDTITIGTDPTALALAAGNLAAIEADGHARPPSQWRAEPAVPDDLRPLQETLTRARLAVTAP